MQHHIPASHALRTASWITRLAYAIAAIGVVTSYGTQVILLLAHGVGKFSYALPATIDILAVIAALALQLPMLDRVTRWIAGGILTATVSVSIAANVMGESDPIARLAHAWPVIAYLLGELLANRVRAYAARLAAVEAAPAISVAELESPGLPEAPVSPAIPSAPKAAGKPGKSRKSYGPRDGERYSERHDRRLRNGR